MPASFDYYKTFYFVAKYKNFTRAANILLSSQPSVTRSMQNLESELGCRLFIRSHHGIALTPEGELLYRYVAPACERILRGEEELGLALGLHGGTVSVGATETALHCLLLDQLMLFQQEHPDVKIRINNGTTSHVLTDLKEGRTDMAVVPTPLQIEKPYAVTKLCPVRTILVGGPRFRNLCDQSNTLGDLKQYPLAGLPASTMAHRFYENFFASHGLPLHYDIELASADLLLPVVIHNLGLAFLPVELAAQALEQGQVFSIPLTEKIPIRHICLVRHPGRPLGAASRRLMEMLVSLQKKTNEEP
ncbi:MAG: LysR family transcriptional regulator [Clostridiales bacterium]|nr:MAG: LysR family transcriptional regulator [Clostridiales bacterium]